MGFFDTIRSAGREATKRLTGAFDFAREAAQTTAQFPTSTKQVTSNLGVIGTAAKQGAKEVGGQLGAVGSSLYDWGKTSVAPESTYDASALGSFRRAGFLGGNDGQTSGDTRPETGNDFFQRVTGQRQGNAPSGSTQRDDGSYFQFDPNSGGYEIEFLPGGGTRRIARSGSTGSTGSGSSFSFNFLQQAQQGISGLTGGGSSLTGLLGGVGFGVPVANAATGEDDGREESDGGFRSVLQNAVVGRLGDFGFGQFGEAREAENQAFDISQKLQAAFGQNALNSVPGRLTSNANVDVGAATTSDLATSTTDPTLFGDLNRQAGSLAGETDPQKFIGMVPNALSTIQEIISQGNLSQGDMKDLNDILNWTSQNLADIKASQASAEELEFNVEDIFGPEMGGTSEADIVQQALAADRKLQDKFGLRDLKAQQNNLQDRIEAENAVFDAIVKDIEDNPNFPKGLASRRIAEQNELRGTRINTLQRQLNSVQRQLGIATETYLNESGIMEQARSRFEKQEEDRKNDIQNQIEQLVESGAIGQLTDEQLQQLVEGARNAGIPLNPTALAALRDQAVAEGNKPGSVIYREDKNGNLVAIDTSDPSNLQRLDSLSGFGTASNAGGFTRSEVNAQRFQTFSRGATTDLMGGLGQDGYIDPAKFSEYLSQVNASNPLFSDDFIKEWGDFLNPEDAQRLGIFQDDIRDVERRALRRSL